jgi:hypothetical protein
VNNLRGTLRVVDAGVACSPDETAVSWNQQGPPGARGADGAPGPVGPAGGGDPEPGGGATPGEVPNRAPALGAPVKKPKPKIKINKKKPKIKIGPPPPGKLYQYSNVQGEGSLAGDFVYLGPNAVKTVARLEVPAGRFFIIADAEGLAAGPEDVNSIFDEYVLCELHTTTGGPVAVKTLEGRNVTAFAMQAVAFSSKPGAIELRCQNQEPTSAFLKNITISAITISSAARKVE